MSDTGIFIVGFFTFLLLGGGFTFSVLEIQRFGREAVVRDETNKRSRQ